MIQARRGDHPGAARAAPLALLADGRRWHLFLSHIWGTGQDQCATIKRQLCLLLPGVSIFDLIQAGLYTALALPFHTGPFRHVASCMIARAIGATQLKLEPKNKLKKATSATTIATTTVAAQKC